MPSSSQSPRDSPARRQRRRRTHQRVDSHGDLEPRSCRRSDYGPESGPSSPSEARQKPRYNGERRSSRAPESEYSRTTTSAALSAGQLAQLDQLNRELGWGAQDAAEPRRASRAVPRTEYDAGWEREGEERDAERERRRQEHRERKRRRREEEKRAAAEEAGEAEELVYEKRRRHRRRDEGRVVSGQKLERGSEGYYSEKEAWREDVRLRGGGGSSNLDYDEDQRKRKRRKKIFIAVGVLVLILVIVIPVGVVVSQNKSSSNSSSSGGANSTQPANSNLAGMSESDIPKQYQGTYMDPFTWYDTEGFNVTFTSEMVGGLSVMGLNSTWNDSTRANSHVPRLDETWQYGTMPVRGVNVGGWLSIEPFLTPSLFSGFSAHDNVVDEWTLTSTLGASKAKTTLEQHYSSFITEQDFADIQAAGFDHVRIPFSYWAVLTYEGDPYVPHVSWRYLLRGIEWARKYGLRVNLDLHGAPGSQNGWNHSGRQGQIRWLNGTDGQLNADRTIAVHNQLSTFFAQPRYKNIIAMYGLVNEPRMVELDVARVLNWTTSVTSTIQGNNYTGLIVFGDGFLGLSNWQGKLQNQKNLLLDVHQYVIFNVQQIVLNHHDKIEFACSGWTQQSLQSMNTATGFGPTICGEWSQADTDCAQYLNNVGVGSRWEGTLNMVDTPGGNSNGSVLTPTCPTHNSPQCSCVSANANPSDYSNEYKQWLLMFAEAQMHSFEQAWGWFYWTWSSESATQWSYKDGLAAGILPNTTWNRSFNCSSTIPDFSSLGLPESY